MMMKIGGYLIIKSNKNGRDMQFKAIDVNTVALIETIQIH